MSGICSYHSSSLARMFLPLKPLARLQITAYILQVQAQRKGLPIRAEPQKRREKHHATKCGYSFPLPRQPSSHTYNRVIFYDEFTVQRACKSRMHCVLDRPEGRATARPSVPGERSDRKKEKKRHKYRILTQQVTPLFVFVFFFSFFFLEGLLEGKKFPLSTFLSPPRRSPAAGTGGQGRAGGGGCVGSHRSLIHSEAKRKKKKKKGILIKDY